MIIPDEVCPQAKLRPLSVYRFRIVHEASGQIIGEGRFETAPAQIGDTPSRIAIALMSCNQPFDRNGVPKTRAEQMYHAVLQELRAHPIKAVLTVGDQIYADAPARLSLLNKRYFATVAPKGRASLQKCTPEEVRQLYQQRYRQFWYHPAWCAMHAHYPCYPILDDHDIVDNWGTNPAHHTAKWQSIRKGALAAYRDYQDARVRPHTAVEQADFSYHFSYGYLGVFVMDVRSQRCAGDSGHLFVESQKAALQRFLDDHRELSCIALVMSVPLIHLPKRIVQTIGHFTPWSESFADRWAASGYCEDRDWLLDTLHTHQRRHAHHSAWCYWVGDIHIGCVHKIDWQPNGPACFQMISSGVTNDTGWKMRLATKLTIRCNRGLRLDRGLRAKVRLLASNRRQRQNPYGKLNMGLLDIDTPLPGGPSKLRFSLYSHQGEQPICVYRSRFV